MGFAATRLILAALFIEAFLIAFELLDFAVQFFFFPFQDFQLLMQGLDLLLPAFLEFPLELTLLIGFSRSFEFPGGAPGLLIGNFHLALNHLGLLLGEVTQRHILFHAPVPMILEVARFHIPLRREGFNHLLQSFEAIFER
jgi:hypothetical protein